MISVVAQEQGLPYSPCPVNAASLKNINSSDNLLLLNNCLDKPTGKLLF